MSGSHFNPRYLLQSFPGPPNLAGSWMTISHSAKALLLDQELPTSLAKGAIKAVDPLTQPRGFYSPFAFAVSGHEGSAYLDHWLTGTRKTKSAWLLKQLGSPRMGCPHLAEPPVSLLIPSEPSQGSGSRNEAEPKLPLRHSECSCAPEKIVSGMIAG